MNSILNKFVLRLDLCMDRYPLFTVIASAVLAVTIAVVANGWGG